MTTQILITGCNRGLGLAFVEEYINEDVHIFATCRNPSEATQLNAIQGNYPNKISILKLEVTAEEEINSVVKQISKKTNHLDILINNAAILNLNDQIGNMTINDVTQVFRVNVASPIRLTQELIPLLTKSSRGKIINISSTAGSISTTSGGYISYSASKAALNMFSKLLSESLAKTNILSISLDPGWMKTDMGDQHAPLDPRESAKHMISLIKYLSIKDSGKYLRFSGEEIPW